MDLISDLRAAIGTDNVLEEPVELHLFSKDASIMRGEATCVAFPQDAKDVSAVIKVAKDHEVPIVPRGAGTGLAGGASPTEGGIVLITTAMKEIDIDVENQTAWVGCGVINLDLTKAAAPYGLHFAPDPSSQSACTIGGNVANNSGGPHCLAEGSTTSHVLALELVLEDGQIVTVGSQAPDAPGLDVKGAVVGSEGTLALVTRALVRLLPNEPDVRTVLMAFPTVEDSAATVSQIIGAGMVPAALELMDQRMTQAVENWLQAGLPIDSAAVLLAEVVGETAGVVSEAEIIADIARANNVESVQVAETEEERALMWLGRKSAFGAVAQMAPDYFLHDAVVPRTKLVETMKAVYEIADRYELTMLNVFHAGDGNLHPLIAFDASDPETKEKVLEAGAEIVGVCVDNGGALSGEHGVAVDKRDLMPRTFSELDLDAQARIKEAFDPTSVFNPHKVLPRGARCFDYGGVRREELPEGVWV